MLTFGLVATVLHEFFHFVALRALGGEGYITFDWNMGLPHYTSLPDFLWAVQLSGGPPYRGLPALRVLVLAMVQRFHT